MALPENSTQIERIQFIVVLRARGAPGSVLAIDTGFAVCVNGEDRPTTRSPTQSHMEAEIQLQTQGLDFEDRGFNQVDKPNDLGRSQFR